MKANNRKFLTAMTFLAGAGLAGSVLAGPPSTVGSITTLPGASGIPTMGGGALMMLSVLLAVIAVRVMRSGKNKAVTMTVALAAVLALASGAGGVHLVSKSVASMGIVITNPNGQTRSVFEGFNNVFNDSGVIQRVTDISLNEGCTQLFEDSKDKDGVGNCSVSPSSDIPDGGDCDLVVDCGNLNGGEPG